MPRYSCRENDPGFINFKRHGYGGFQSITVDGVEILDRCITADEDLGEALCNVRNSSGKFFLNDAGDAAAQEKLRGDVIVTLRSA